MDFQLSPRALEAADAARAFLDAFVLPLERVFLERGWAAVEADLAELRQRVRAAGLAAPHMPRELGGMGLSLLEFAHVGEVLGRSPLGHYAFNCQAPDAGNMELLLQHGSAEQRERWLLPLVQGEIRSCFAMTEPELPGSNPVWLATTARAEGDGYVLSGHKWSTSAAPGSASSAWPSAPTAVGSRRRPATPSAPSSRGTASSGT